MCRITRRHARLHRISTADLLARLGLPAIDTCITRRQLRWAGHVSRMEYSRLPRKMLSGWVRSKRPRGCPRFTYGRTLQKSLQKARIDSTTWPILAQNRAQSESSIKHDCVIFICILRCELRNSSEFLSLFSVLREGVSIYLSIYLLLSS